MDLPPGINLSTLVSLPAEIPQAEVAQFSCEVAPTRPLTLTGTILKVMVVGLNDRLSALAARTVVGQQLGFIPGRKLAVNIYVAEGAMMSGVLAGCLASLRSSAPIANRPSSSQARWWEHFPCER